MIKLNYLAVNTTTRTNYSTDLYYLELTIYYNTCILLQYTLEVSSYETCTVHYDYVNYILTTRHTMNDIS